MNNIDLIVLIILFITMLIFCRYSLKRWKKAKIVWIVIFIIILIIGLIIAYRKTSFHSFSLNTDDKYIVTTSDINYTYLIDGGTHYNTYYEIDFSKNKIEFRQDYVYVNTSSFYIVRFLKSYSEKLIAKGTLDDLQVEQLKLIFENRIQEGDAEEDITNSSEEESREAKWNGIEDIISYYNHPWKISSMNAQDIAISGEEKDEFLEIVSEVFDEEEN